jgi:hypothetical protein
MRKLYTERQGQGKPRTAEALDDPTKMGLMALVAALMAKGWFGEAFPEMCTDGYGNCGCDQQALWTMMGAYGVVRPDVRREDAATDAEVFDLLEFSYEKMALPIEGDFHSYMRHNHYAYDQAAGRAQFQEEVNRLFERNGIAFELKDGEVSRIGAATFHETLAAAAFKTGDADLDAMLEEARHKFLNRDEKIRRESLERLWDAWERLKTVGPGKDKKAKVTGLLDATAPEATFRQVLEDEANALTAIGNGFMIRHTEVGRVPVRESRDVDYLFQRLFSLVLLLLRANGLGQ